MDKLNKSFIETVAEKLIEQLKEGVAPWQRPWAITEPGSHMPSNPTTGQRYKGINAIYLLCQGHADHRWMTYKQAAKMGAQVRKGETGTPIQFWKFSEEQPKRDESGKRIVDATGAPATETVMLERPRVFFGTVFNAEQIDGLPHLEPRNDLKWDPIKRADQVLKASGAAFVSIQQQRAFYRPSNDTINLPERERFPTAGQFYATALHELAHWTGHESRLDRDLAHPFGSEGYAREELRAEIASMILGDQIGIGHDPGQHAAYVGSWIKVLQDDPLEVFRAAADAEKVQGFVLSLEQSHIQKQEDQVRNSGAVRLLDEWIDAFHRNLQRTDCEPSRKEVLKGAVSLMREMQDEILIGGAREFDARYFAKERKSGVSKELHDLALDELAGVIKTLRNCGMTIMCGDEMRTNPFDFRVPSESATSRPSTNSDQNSGAQKSTRIPLPLQDAAEDWTIDHILEGDFGSSIAVIDMAQLLRVSYVFDDMQPVNAQNDFWERHPLPSDGQEFGRLIDIALADLTRRIAELRDEQEASEKLAREDEARVRRNPNSTNEDVSAAREVRKSAELNTTLMDVELQRRVAEGDRAQGASSAATGTQAERIFIQVPFKQKDEAKVLGAKWDRQQQSWYVPAGLESTPFAKWMEVDVASVATVAPAQPDGQRGVETATNGRIFLVVPYDDRKMAKAAGAKWDKAAKSWYAGPKAQLSKLEKWRPENAPSQQAPAMTTKEEFAEALKSVCCVISGEHPIMDGRTHRISVEGERPSEHSGSGFYVAHLDGHPAGYVKNNKTGAEMKWKAKGYSLSAAEKAAMQADAAVKLSKREASRQHQHEQTAERLVRQVKQLRPITAPTPYMVSKGIEPQPGAYTDKDGKTMCIPAVDVDGKQWTMQYISDDGRKRFAKDSQKEGCFHVVGGAGALAAVAALIICEGYATASSLSKAIGLPVIAAFDSGNLPHVAKRLRAKFPNKPIVIAGDNDVHLEATRGTNPGKEKAIEAASATGGNVIFPIFAPGEQQRDPRGFTDFNDLVSKSLLGRDGIERQLRPIIGAVAEVKNYHAVSREHAKIHQAIKI